MFCCGKKKREYEINPDDDPNVVKEKPNDSKADSEQIDKDKNDEKKEDIGKSNGDIEAPIQVTVSDQTQAAPQQTSPSSPNKETDQTGLDKTGESGDKTDEPEKVKNPKYVSQMSMCSSLSIREEINRNREIFFSNTSLNDPSFQEDWNSFNKRLSRTDEKFAEYQRRIRARKRLAEEEEMSAEQMQQAVSRLEAVASRLESLAVSSPRPAGGSGSGAGDIDAGRNCLNL